MITNLFLIYMMFWLAAHELRGWIEMAYKYFINDKDDDEPMPESVQHMYS